MIRARRAALLRGIYVIVNEGPRALEIAQSALESGVAVIQYRAKGGANAERVHALRELAQTQGALLIFNDDWRAARSFGCGGVHLGPGDDGFEHVREIRDAWPEAIVGLSCGTQDEMRAARLAGADYAGVGAVFATTSKADAGKPIGIAGLRRIAASAPLPVAAIGGISVRNVAEVRRTGVAMAAVISAIADAPDARAAARALVAAWKTPSVLSIGTAHPRNVVGTGRDLVVGTELRCSVFTVIAALSEHDDAGVQRVHAMPPALVRESLTSLQDSRPDAIRVGALGSAENVAEVAAYLRRNALPAVVDPVRRASTGEPLIDEETWNAVWEQLAALPTVTLTPNLDEARAALGRDVTADTMEAAAEELRSRGAAAVLLKGGHLEGDPVDVLATAGGRERFSEPRRAVQMRGTGCTLAMAMACELAAGGTIREAVVAARAYLGTKMTASVRE